MKAIVLLSGGLASAVTLYTALEEGYECVCLLFDYGQTHRRELVSAMTVAERAGCAWRRCQRSHEAGLWPWAGWCGHLVAPGP